LGRIGAIVTKLIRMALREIPLSSDAAIARRLIARADAARDARQYGVAAGLYQEALRLNPGNPRTRIQCGHMLKESGDLQGAEDQYERARQDLPDDADLALQIGHLHKIAGQPERAQDAYRRALALQPGWIEAERELASVGGALALEGDDEQTHKATLDEDESDAGHSDMPAAWATADGDDVSKPQGRKRARKHPDWVVPDLLPRADAAPPPSERDILRLFRLGGRRAHSRWGDLKVMRGIEAIRGYRLAPPGLTEIRLMIDGKPALSEPLQAHDMEGDGEPQTKYVFNLWHDFSDVTPGRHLIQLEFLNASGRCVRRHGETVLVAAPLAEDAYPGSDALVAAGAGDIAQAVNARPSMIRDVERRLLPDPVRSVLVQRADQLGDLVCSVPAIRRLRALFPDARLVGLVSPANVGLAGQLGLFDAIETVDFSENLIERRRTVGIEAQGRLREALTRHCFDIAIDLCEGDDSRALLLLSGAKFLYGFKDRQSPWLDAGLDFNAHDPVNVIEVIPPSRKLVLLIEGLAVMMHNQATPALNPDRSGLAERGIGEGERYAVIHAGARLAYSRWPHFDTLVAMLLERTDLKVVLFSDDAATALAAAEAAGHSARVHVVQGQIPFAEFDALLSHCTIFVGNDSGPKHLAALRGAPVVSLHMARLNWSEWGQEMRGRIISRRVPCAGCGIGLDGEDCGKEFACLRNIRPEEVFAAVEQVL